MISGTLLSFLLGLIREFDFEERKLNRVLVNDAWLSTFPHSSAEFVPATCSNHCYSLVRLKGADMAHPKPFKYFSFWSKHPVFLQVVQKAWSNDEEGVPMFNFYEKHSNVNKFKGYDKDHINSISQQVPQGKAELLSLQQRGIFSSS